MRVRAVGIFVGGAATRMAGKPKGLLRAPSGETIVQRWVSMFARWGIRAVLVGEHPAYNAEGLDYIGDRPPGIGPLGGLAGLLHHFAGERVIAVACDMPLVSSELVRRLLEYPGDAPAVAPRLEGRWEPLFARYDSGEPVLRAAEERIRAGRHALQGLLDDLGASELPLVGDEAGELCDWDGPSDLPQSRTFP